MPRTILLIFDRLFSLAIRIKLRHNVWPGNLPQHNTDTFYIMGGLLFMLVSLMQTSYPTHNPVFCICCCSVSLSAKSANLFSTAATAELVFSSYVQRTIYLFLHFFNLLQALGPLLQVIFCLLCFIFIFAHTLFKGLTLAGKRN